MHITDHGSNHLPLTFSPLNFVRAYARQIRERRAINELRRLDDHMLKDLGLTRGEIYDVVRNGRP